MGHSTNMHQDIVDEIVKRISDDMSTLKACSLAARSFYQPTRRYLFAATALNRPDAVDSLDQTLAFNPQLSLYIRSLEIPSLSSEITISKIIQILPALSQIRRLVIGVRKPAVDVHMPSSPEVSMLLHILQLPLLETLEIFLIHGFPKDLLHIPRRLKHLILWNMFLAVTDSYPTAQPLLQLKDLHLYHVRNFIETSGINAPNLCRVVIGGGASNIQSIIETGAQSVETLVWYQYSDIDIPYYLVEDLATMFHNLRHLCIIVSDNRGEGRGMYSVRKMLYRNSLAERLEKFTFVLGKVWHDSVTAPILGFLVLGDFWTDLADKLRFPSLNSATIHLVIEGRNQSQIDPKAFHTLVSQELPLLAEAGLLQTMVCKQLDLEDLL